MKKSLLIASLMAVAAMSLSACNDKQARVATAEPADENVNPSPSAAGSMASEAPPMIRRVAAAESPSAASVAASDPPMSDILKTRPRVVAAI